jgi:hypothetical protein
MHCHTGARARLPSYVRCRPEAIIDAGLTGERRDGTDRRVLMSTPGERFGVAPAGRGGGKSLHGVIARRA